MWIAKRVTILPVLAMLAGCAERPSADANAQAADQLNAIADRTADNAGAAEPVAASVLMSGRARMNAATAATPPKP